MNTSSIILTEHCSDHVQLRGAGSNVAATGFDGNAFVGILLALRGGILLRVVTARPVDASVANGGNDGPYHVLLILHGFPVNESEKDDADDLCYLRRAIAGKGFEDDGRFESGGRGLKNQPYPATCYREFDKDISCALGFR